MKRSTKEYVKAIEKAQKFNLQNFLRLLEKNNDTKKLKGIVALVEKAGYRNIVIETARKLKKVWRFKKNDKIKEEVNPKLIAGVRITIDSKRQLDLSFKNLLEKVFHEQ